MVDSGNWCPHSSLIASVLPSVERVGFSLDSCHLSALLQASEKSVSVVPPVDQVSCCLSSPFPRKINFLNTSFQFHSEMKQTWILCVEGDMIFITF